MVSGSLLDAAEERLPTTPGTCVLTEISTISSRLVDGRTGKPIRGSGSAVGFTNKGYQVSGQRSALCSQLAVPRFGEELCRSQPTWVY
jgi:hypothetical protein